MHMANFNLTVSQGDAGSRFVYEHLEEILSGTHIAQSRDAHTEHIGGGDIKAVMLHTEKAEAYDPSEDWAGIPGMKAGSRTEINAVVSGAIEVKTVWGFLFRTNDHGMPCGTLEFELWSSGNEGWLPKYLHPERYMEDGETPKVVQPAVLVFLLMAYDMPFGCVAFEDFGALAERLKEYGEEIGVDPENPLMEGAYGPDAIVEGNMWYVPFDRIADLGTVTMIGDMPGLRPDIVIGKKVECSTELQKEKFETLN